MMSSPLHDAAIGTIFQLIEMSEISIIEGEVFRDARGQISSLNHFGLEGVRRMFFIHHPDVSVVRGWHGHRLERKWFYCVYGRFTLGLVEIDDWQHPSRELRPTWLDLNDQESRIMCVPAGWASWIKAEVKDSTLMVMSDRPFGEMLKEDSYRFPPELWLDGRS